ncbi:hypothetical protein KEM55_002035, partial [Ascosphaera atra]
MAAKMPYGLRKGDDSCDLTIICRRGRQHRVHKSIMSMAFPVIDRAESRTGVFNLDEHDAEIVSRVIGLAYNGGIDFLPNDIYRGIPTEEFAARTLPITVSLYVLLDYLGARARELRRLRNIICTVIPETPDYTFLEFLHEKAKVFRNDNRITCEIGMRLSQNDGRLLSTPGFFDFDFSMLDMQQILTVYRQMLVSNTLGMAVSQFNRRPLVPKMCYFCAVALHENLLMLKKHHAGPG